MLPKILKVFFNEQGTYLKVVRKFRSKSSTEKMLCCVVDEVDKV